jgi:hypothetical protein
MSRALRHRGDGYQPGLARPILLSSLLEALFYVPEEPMCAPSDSGIQTPLQALTQTLYQLREFAGQQKHSPSPCS